MKKVKNVISVILVLLIAILLSASSVLVILNRYTEKDYLISKMEEVEIYKQIYNEVQNGFEDYIYQSGLEIGAFKRIVDEEKIKEDFTSIMDTLYSDGEVSIDIEFIKTNLDAEIRTYVEQQGRKLTVEEEQNILEFENLIANSYGNSISSYVVLKNRINSQTQLIEKISTITTVSIVLTVVAIAALVLLYLKNLYQGIGLFGSALLVSGFILVFTKTLVFDKIDIDNLIIMTQALSTALRYILKEIIRSITTSGTWCICIGLFIIIMTSILGLDTKNITYNNKDENKKEVKDKRKSIPKGNKESNKINKKDSNNNKNNNDVSTDKSEKNIDNNKEDNKNKDNKNNNNSNKDNKKRSKGYRNRSNKNSTNKNNNSKNKNNNNNNSNNTNKNNKNTNKSNNNKNNKKNNTESANTNKNKKSNRKPKH